jgi:hypothetical protein
VRPSPDALVESVLVLSTLGAPERRRLGRKPRPVGAGEAEPEPVPTSRATIVRAAAFRTDSEASGWLSGLRAAPDELDGEVDTAVAVLNRALRAHRIAAADPYVAEVSASRALVARVGYGGGESVADGRFAEAVELPRSGEQRVKRSMEAPEERFAALLSGRAQTLPAEELVLRARADLNAGRPREAALQARVAIEALLAAVDDDTVAGHRDAVAAGANAALRGDLPGDAAASLEEAVSAMEMVLKRRRLGG